MEDINKVIRKNALNLGLVLGVVLFVYGVIMLYVMSSWVSMIAVFVSLLLSLVVMILAGVFFSIDLRKKIGGFWGFKQAVSGIFIMFFVGFVISGVANFLFTKFVEPGIELKMQENIKQASVTMMTNQGVDQAKIDEQVQKMDEEYQARQNPTIGKRIQGIAIGIVIMFVCALIFAAIVKKERPVIITDDEA